MVAGGAGRVPRARAAVTVGPEHTFPGGDNRSCDICVHPSTGQPHVVWETNDGHIKYSYYDGSRWRAPEQVPGAVNVGARHDRFRNGAVSMVIDSRGRVHIVYSTTGPPNRLYHIRQKAAGRAWSTPVLVHDGRRAELTWVQMARNRRDELFVTFEQGFRGYRCEHNGSSWVGPTPLIARTSHVHCVAVGPDDVPRIIFKAKRRGYEAYLATRRRTGWKVAQITNEGGRVDEPFGAVDALNRLHVIWSKCAEEGHDAVLKYQTYTGSTMTGTEIAKSNAHNFCRLVFDEGGATYAFMPRRYPPKFVVREAKGGRWSAPIPLGGRRQGYWFFEADAHGNEVHVVYSNWYGPDRPKSVTYRRITRTKGAAKKPSRVGTGLMPDPSNPRWLLQRFINSFEFWKCAPNTAKIVPSSDALVVAETGRQYAFYAPNGSHFKRSFAADLSEARGAFRARWFNPRNGRFRAPFRVSAAPAVKLTLPTDEDWALLLDKRERE